MPAPVSIIIPVFDAAAVILPTLTSLAPGLDTGVIRELIIADGGSDDEIAVIADHAGASLVSTAKGRGIQLAAGAAEARGDWLLFLHADTVLPPDWPQVVLAHINARPGSAGYFLLAFDQPGLRPHLTAAWANLRSRLFGLPFGDQGLLIRRDLYSLVGGYAASPLFEDADLALRLRGRLEPLQTTVVTSFQRYRRNGWLRQGWRNQLLLMRWLAGADPAVLARRYS